MPTYTETFTHADGTNLGGTTAPNGATYVTNGTWVTTSNRAVGGSHVYHEYLAADWGSADGTVSAAMHSPGNQDYGLALRIADTSNFVRLLIEYGVAYLQIYVAGTPTILGSWAVSVGGGKVLAVAMAGNVYTVSYDGTVLGSATDAGSHHLTETVHGLYSYQELVAFDDLTVDVASTVTPPALDAGHFVLHGGDLSLSTPAGGPLALDAGHFVLHGGTLYLLAAGATARTFALAPAIRAPVAYGPVISTDTPPLPLATRLYRAVDLNDEVAHLTASYGRQWQDQLNEPGTATVVLANDDPALADVRLGDVVRFELYGWAAFAMLVRGTDRVSLDAGEELAEATTITGPGVLAILDTALVFPSRGVGATPIEEERLFSWVSVDYDDSAWTAVNPITNAHGNTTPAWYGIASTWPDDGAQMIWAPEGNEILAPGGPCYFRKTFYVGEATRAVVYAIMEDIGELWLDGQKIIQGEQWTNFPADMKNQEVDLDVGWHTLAGVVTNSEDGPAYIEPYGWFNPGSFTCSVHAVDQFGHVAVDTLAKTDDTWRMVAYPLHPPGMTPGEVLRHVIEEAQTRGALTALTLNFTDETDSDGVAWPEVGDIACKVGVDILTFARELTATYIDVWMEPGSWRLWAWVQDGRGDDRPTAFTAPLDAHDPTSGNLSALTHRRAL